MDLKTAISRQVEQTTYNARFVRLAMQTLLSLLFIDDIC
jgi:hypothetical protein